jgi:archaeal type IV pilus assembly protein PilA
MSYNHEDAVSPVVGVMLMLIVTIIIASVVSAYAGGLWGNTEKAPGVTLQARINVPNNMTLTHIEGDPFLIRDVKLIVNNANNDTSMIFTNTSVTANLKKKEYSNPNNEAPGLIRAGDAFVGSDETDLFFVTGQEYHWTVIHIPSQKMIATGKVFS